MIRDENFRNKPLPLDTLFKRCLMYNRLLPPIEFCPDCGTWHNCLLDCIMKNKEKEIYNGTSEKS